MFYYRSGARNNFKAPKIIHATPSGTRMAQYGGHLRYKVTRNEV
jgi:hypothetical protein